MWVYLSGINFNYDNLLLSLHISFLKGTRSFKVKCLIVWTRPAGQHNPSNGRDVLTVGSNGEAGCWRQPRPRGSTLLVSCRGVEVYRDLRLINKIIVHLELEDYLLWRSQTSKLILFSIISHFSTTVFCIPYSKRIIWSSCISWSRTSVGSCQKSKWFSSFWLRSFSGTVSVNLFCKNCIDSPFLVSLFEGGLGQGFKAPSALWPEELLYWLKEWKG